MKYFKLFSPRFVEKLNQFYQSLKAETSISITSDLKDTLESAFKSLSDACELTLKQPFPGKQYVPIADASFRSAGYALLIEDNPAQKIQSKRKTYAPVAFGLKTISPAQLKISIFPNEILAIYVALLEFAHILSETTKRTVFLTNIKSVTSFFQTKSIQTGL